VSPLTVHWTAAAIADVREAWEFIAQDNESAADLIIQRIEAIAGKLPGFPKLGRPGAMRGTRELSVPGTPYRLIYTAAKTQIEIYRVLHGARAWPPKRKRS
jgi:toxin ParE1/3/4